VIPHILEDDEEIISLSLGAGNTGKKSDLITNKRIAEFKFVDWKGGPESIRQNRLFKDFVYLLWEPGDKKRELYLLGLEIAERFFNGGRSVESVLSRDRSFENQFRLNYGSKYQFVREFYKDTRDKVKLIDINIIHPDLAAAFSLDI
jgi:hypothetical protein